MKGKTSLVLTVAVVVMGATVGCATTEGPTASSQRDRVTGEELATTNASTVYEALERLRPDWLSGRGAVSMTDESGSQGDPATARPNVYMSGMRMGGLDYLRQVYVQDVELLRFWQPGEASARFGMGNPRGVIEVIPRS